MLLTVFNLDKLSKSVYYNVIMMEPKDYIADWPDMPYANFSEWLSDLAAKYGDKTAIFYRSGKQKEFTRWSFKKLDDESRRLGRGFLAAGR
jgi:long-chain acyl-CoA synthetase